MYCRRKIILVGKPAMPRPRPVGRWAIAARHWLSPDALLARWVVRPKLLVVSLVDIKALRTSSELMGWLSSKCFGWVRMAALNLFGY